MNEFSNVIEVADLVRSYGKVDAVNGLNMKVQRGRCYGFFGRNGAGKTTTIKCLLNLLKPDSGTVRMFGSEPHKREVEIKSRLTYVPDAVAFYPWMTIQQYFDYLASFRARWNRKLEQDLLGQFGLDAKRKVTALSRGEKMQVALIGALCPEPELLLLDEPTSGLDPLVRREFIRTIIGAYLDSDPGNRTVFVSTHLITEFEGLIDEFTVIDQGKAVLSLETEIARQQFKRLRVRFNGDPPELKHSAIVHAQRNGRELEIVINSQESEVRAEIDGHRTESVSVEALSLEEIFLASLRMRRNGS